MPGVNLDFLPASQAPEVLGSPDSVCAESSLEEVIGDLLAQEDEEEPFGERKFELTLRCAVGEIHSDLQAFGKRVDRQLEEAVTQVTPLAEAVTRLQEENQRLRIQQERLVRQVEALCQAMGLPDPSLHALPSTETLWETSPPSSDSPSSDSPSCKPQTTAPNAPQESSSCTSPDPPSSVLEDTSPSATLDTPICEPQDSDSVSNRTNTAQTPEPSPVPHPPTFATRRSLSAPSLMGHISCNSTVLLR